LVTREEKERRVIELTEEHKSIREIAKEVNMSFATIGSIRRRYSGESKSTKEGTSAPPSKDTQVFTFFELGKTPVDVAIALDIQSDEVRRLYKAWQELKGLHQLNELYEETGDDIFQFHRTYKYIKDEGYTPRQLIDVADHLDELTLLRSEREQLVKENQDLESQKQDRTTEYDQLNEGIGMAQQELNAINIDIQVNREELERLDHRKRQTQTVIASMQNSAGHEQIREIAGATARSILTENKVMLAAALRALLQALKDEPRNELQLLIYGSLNYPLYDPKNGNRPLNYAQMRQAVLLQSAEQMYTDLLAKVVANTMSSALTMPTGSKYPR
jgi:DNA-binding Lrp family transcriptional regulator